MAKPKAKAEVKKWTDLSDAEAAMSAPAAISHAVSLLKAIDNDVHVAIALAEINRPASYDADIVDRFENTYDAHAFNLMRNQMTLTIVLTLTRMWDTDGDSRSIPNVAKFLDHPHIVDEIASRQRKGRLSLMDHPPFAERAIAEPGFGQIIERMAKKEADQAEQDVRTATSDLYSRVDNFLQSKLKASLEALRNRSIAHNTELTRKEKQAIATGSRIDPVKIGDEEQALKLSTSIITDLNLCSMTFISI